MNQAALRVLAVATVMSIPALAEDQYLFGDSDGGGASDTLASNSSTELRLFEAGWYARGAGHHSPSNGIFMAGLCSTCADAGAYDSFFSFYIAGPGGEASFNDLAGGVGYGAPIHLVGESASSPTVSLYGGAVTDLDANIAHRDPQWARGGTVQPGALDIPPAQGPGTYALMLAGLGAVGFVATRRRF